MLKLTLKKKNAGGVPVHQGQFDKFSRTISRTWKIISMTCGNHVLLLRKSSKKRNKIAAN